MKLVPIKRSGWERGWRQKSPHVLCEIKGANGPVCSGGHHNVLAISTREREAKFTSGR